MTCATNTVTDHAIYRMTNATMTAIYIYIYGKLGKMGHATITAIDQWENDTCNDLQLLTCERMTNATITATDQWENDTRNRYSY